MTFGIKEYTDRIKPIAMNSYRRFSSGINTLSRDISDNAIACNAMDKESICDFNNHPISIKHIKRFIPSIEEVTGKINGFNMQNSKASKRYRLIYTKDNTFLYIYKGDIKNGYDGWR